MDPYEVLGVSRTAGAKRIKLAFRKRSMETHPDRAGSAEAFQEVTREVAERHAEESGPLRCPFCGGVGEVKESADCLLMVECQKCGARGPTDGTSSEAIAEWNKRK